MRVLVTGASGFIGGHIARKLLEKGYEVNVLIRKSSNTANILGFPYKVHFGDLRDKEAVRAALVGCSGLFHAAAMYGFWARAVRSSGFLSGMAGRICTFMTAARVA